MSEMASGSKRSSGSSGSSNSRKQVVITPEQSRDGRERNSSRRKHKPIHDGDGRRPSTPSVKKRAPERDAKRAAREERLRKQRRAMWAKIGAVLFVLAGLVAGVIALYSSSTFTITTVDVEGANELTADDVTSAAALPPGSTLLRYPREEMEERLRLHPWIADVRISRRFPHTLIIHVNERAPVALVDVGEAHFWLVDAAATVLGERTPETTETVTIVRDLPGLTPVAGERLDSAVLDNALTIIEGLSDDLRAQVRAVSAPSVDLTTLITVNDVEILVGSAEEIEKKDLVARQIIAEQGENVVHINVRTVDRPTWRGIESGQ